MGDRSHQAWVPKFPSLKGHHPDPRGPTTSLDALPRSCGPAVPASLSPTRPVVSAGSAAGLGLSYPQIATARVVSGHLRLTCGSRGGRHGLGALPGQLPTDPALPRGRVFASSQLLETETPTAQNDSASL